MGSKKKRTKKSLSINSKLYKEVSRESRLRSKKSESGLERGLDQHLEKALSVDLDVIFQRRLREDGFV